MISTIILSMRHQRWTVDARVSNWNVRVRCFRAQAMAQSSHDWRERDVCLICELMIVQEIALVKPEFGACAILTASMYTCTFHVPAHGFKALFLFDAPHASLRC